MSLTNSLFFTTEDVAELYGISIRTVEGWRNKQIGPTWIKIGGAVRYPLSGLEKFEAATAR